MGKVMGFMAGAFSGALVGAVVVLLITPASGAEIIRNVQDRWQLTKDEARSAMEEKQQEMERQYRLAKQG